MKLEVGMYVRYNGQIMKITELGYNNETFMSNENGWFSLYNCDASHNIIDLIEVGDYVNGYPVYEIVEYEDNTRAIVIGDDNKSIIWEESSQYIKSIVTKEQFESISYNLEE